MATFASYLELFPELKQEIRARCTHAGRCMLAMTCKSERAAAAPADRTTLPENLVADDWQLASVFLERFGAPHPIIQNTRDGKPFLTYSPEDGARIVPPSLAVRVYHAALERGYLEEFVFWAEDVFCEQTETRKHLCHLCCQAAVRSNDIQCVRRIYQPDTEIPFPDFSLQMGQRLPVTKETTEWRVEEVLATYAFYENNANFLKRIFDEFVLPGKWYIDMNFDELGQCAHNNPVRELHCMDAVKVLHDTRPGGAYYLGMEFLRRNLVHGMIQQHWIPERIEATLAVYSLGEKTWSHADVLTDEMSVSDYVKWAIAYSNPLAARYFVEKARRLLRNPEWLYARSDYEDAFAAAIARLQDSGQPDFLAIVAS